MQILKSMFKPTTHVRVLRAAMICGLAVVAVLTSCTRERPTAPPGGMEHLEYFGFSLVDVGWDDPLDTVPKTTYTDEVAAFSNIADVLVVSPTQTIVPRMQHLMDQELKTVLHVNEIFFIYAGVGGPSGALYDLRPDYQARWNDFVGTNQLTVNHAMVQAFYVGEEPTWNSITYAELKAATDLIKATIPQVPVLVIEAYPMVDSIQVPTSVDWLGFDHYFIPDPQHNVQFLNELDVLKAKRSTAAQKIVLVMDAHYIQELHGDYAGLTETGMKDVATSYFNLAASDRDVVALIGYAWPGGFDAPHAQGARQLPQSVRDEYARIGKLITGK
ncbi:MAG: hypothetical protein H0T53_16420 [Herpetosiphonaceae bacterium]|nr:hypothetical protein [Herpetosiphonaceae bacterium]